MSTESTSPERASRALASNASSTVVLTLTRAMPHLYHSYATAEQRENQLAAWPRTPRVEARSAAFCSLSRVTEGMRASWLTKAVAIAMLAATAGFGGGA